MLRINDVALCANDVALRANDVMLRINDVAPAAQMIQGLRLDDIQPFRADDIHTFGVMICKASP